MEKPATLARRGSGASWHEIDQALKSIALRRATLDAEEARWLRAGEAMQIWKPLGMVSMIDYLERVLGYGPRAAQDRMRVARGLGYLPAMAAALESGELCFSAVRELTRVATPETEHDWIDRARGKNLRQIEELVRRHDEPGYRNHVLRFELRPETYAVLRQARQRLEEEQGRYLDDDELIDALAHAVLDGGAEGRARYQIAISRCDVCHKAEQHAAGAMVAISEDALARAECDAQSIEGKRATHAVPPATQRLVRLRDHGQCRVPGCRSARNLELHHIVHREHGGTHNAGNLILVCGSCHKAHHEGRLRIAGNADQLEVTRAHVGVEREPVMLRASGPPGPRRRDVRRAKSRREKAKPAPTQTLERVPKPLRHSRGTG